MSYFSRFCSNHKYSPHAEVLHDKTGMKVYMVLLVYIAKIGTTHNILVTQSWFSQQNNHIYITSVALHLLLILCRLPSTSAHRGHYVRCQSVWLSHFFIVTLFLVVTSFNETIIKHSNMSLFYYRWHIRGWKHRTDWCQYHRNRWPWK